MAVVGALIGTFGLLALIIGVVMFLPLRALRSRRGSARRLAIGGGIAFVTGLIFTPTPPVDVKKRAVQSSTAKINGASQAIPPVPVAPDTGSEQSKVAFVVLYRNLIDNAKPCDQSVTDLGKVASSGDQYSSYRVAKAGYEACQRSAISINNMSSPAGLNSEGEEAVKKALKTCESAYIYRQMAMEKAMEVADGEGKPSVVSDMVDDLKISHDGVMLCVAQWFMAARTIKIDPRKLS